MTPRHGAQVEVRTGLLTWLDQRRCPDPRAGHIGYADRMDARRREVRDLADGLVRSLQRVGVMLTYDRDGVAALEAYVVANRVHWSDADRDRMCSQIGSFLGECLVVVYGAQWSEQEPGQGPGVVLSTGDTAFPITKAYKCLHGETDDGFVAFFDRTGTSIARGRGKD
jgi:hypothetical protein